MDATSEKRLAFVNPVLAQKVRQLALRLAMEDGINIIVAQGYRSYHDQEVLYAKGRTAAGPRVTDCQPGHSWHNFGLACDVCPLGAQGQPDWNSSHPAWAKITEVALDMGFVCGAKFRTRPDLPHLQMTGKWAEEVPDQARQVLLDTDSGGGIAGVWKESGLATTAA